jgi:hypothetical protein
MDRWHLFCLRLSFLGWRCWRSAIDGQPARWMATRHRALKEPQGYQRNSLAADSHVQLRRALTWQRNVDELTSGAGWCAR